MEVPCGIWPLAVICSEEWQRPPGSHNSRVSRVCVLLAAHEAARRETDRCERFLSLESQPVNHTFGPLSMNRLIFIFDERSAKSDSS